MPIRRRRVRLGLRRGRPIELRELDDRIGVEPGPTAMSTVQRPGDVVAVAKEKVPPSVVVATGIARIGVDYEIIA